MVLDKSLQALHDCHAAVQGADMAGELRAIGVPVLIVAGDRDVSAPLDLTARRSAALIPDARLRVIEGAAHGMFPTHVGQVNAGLLEFIGQGGYIGATGQEASTWTTSLAAATPATSMTSPPRCATGARGAASASCGCRRTAASRSAT
ncbi:MULTISPECIES: alpha/beta fold hydrolase [unclassified Massilia]|uniref:alpha/beta fold hydrolase n=1 Tax=unclassified Massilia TaxID=2609279 RepID=UPI001E4815FD|nr:MULTISPECIES: alpha/beta hydrolase [unclassified Massilia]